MSTTGDPIPAVDACPSCYGACRVLASYRTDDARVRRRECKSCARRWSTIETAYHTSSVIPFDNTNELGPSGTNGMVGSGGVP